MRTLVIIRVYPKDDYIAYLCYKSFKKVMKADYIFFAEDGNYKYINRNIWIRPNCGNFGGRSNVLACLEGLKGISTKRYDKIIFSDADITVHKNPLELEFDFGGIQHVGNPRHYSGQMLIFSRDIFDQVVNFDYDPIFEKFIMKGKDIADDTMFSHVATALTNNTFDFNGKGYWTHEKLHHLE